ncbi:PAS domain S-box protein [Xenophilus arseniciresistens]|uniref:histidine kinase n=1 Tax=Xenophilus arseniciresistens TaxID=1283306 RepID=A0AAE3N8P1_9BURK|nr:PAS domain S-box protein [Xenophilus arseniciresistens]MDA7417181.1 PAS domain S-box protein [Xenophilus arseniciresistens]
MGPQADWPAALRGAIDLILPSQAQIVLFWGPQFVAFYNDAYAPTIGAKHPAAMGRPAVEHWGELWDDLHSLLHRVLARGETVAARDRPFQINRHGHLEQVFFDISYSPIREADARVAGVLCVVSETTDRVRAAQALAASEVHLRELHEQGRMAQEAGGVNVFQLDIQRDCVYASPGFCRLFGLPEQAVIPSSQIEALRAPHDPLDPGDEMSTHVERLSGDAPLVVEFPILRANDGARRWVARRAEIVRDEQGRPVLMRGVVQDVTERHASRRALEALNATLEQRVEQRTRERDRLWRLATDVMVITRLDGRVEAVNPAWHALLGWSEDEMVGRPILELVAPEDRQFSAVQLDRMAEGQVLTRFENRWLHKDGSQRTLSWSAVPHEGFIHAVGRDVTAARESEQRLRHSQKMEAIGQLTGGIAHDFNNMLQGITGALEVMRRRVAKGQVDDLQRFMDSATQSASRAASLVQRLLAFSRRQSLDLRAVDVNALIGSMEELMTRTLGEQIRLQLHLAEDARAAFGDESQLESAILNLAINARDAMPHGGELHLSTSNVQLGEAEVRHIDGLRPGPYLAIAVRDTGTGMPADVLAQAFDPFFTTKPLGQGTGLGLSMIYGFAQQAGGHARIDSAPGQGTTVTLLLPHAPEADALPVAPATPAQPSALPQGQGEVVLVVEDDPGVRLLVLELLHEMGYATLQAADGRAALPILRSDTRIDLLVSDVGLPGVNGRQLAEIARLHRPELRVLFMTGYSEYATHRAQFLGPGMEMISKPFRVDEIAHRIRDMLSPARAISATR